MTYRYLPKNLPDLLRAEGLTVVELPGWATRGRPASTGNFQAAPGGGSLWHHTGDAANGKAYATGILTSGRSDLPGPLCHLSIDRQGVVYVVAGGRANHAGEAKSVGTMAAGDGNAMYVGIEVQNTGTEGYGDAQMTAMLLTGKVLHRDVLKTSAEAANGHYETSTEGKWDPGMPKAKGGVAFHGEYVLDMDDFRTRLAAALTAPKGKVVAPAKKPVKTPTKKPTPVPQPPAPKPPVTAGATRHIIMCTDTNVALEDPFFRTYYADTFPDFVLCWDDHTPALDSHDTRLIDGIFGKNVTFRSPAIRISFEVDGKRIHKPAALDHNGASTIAVAGGQHFRVFYQSLNDKKTNGKWQAPTDVVVPWLAAAAASHDVVITDESISPNIAKAFRAALGKGWTVRRIGEYMVATRVSMFKPVKTSVEWVLSKIKGLVGWRQDHAADFEYTLVKAPEHHVLFVDNHAPSGVENGSKFKPGKQLDAHKAGDKALAGKLAAWEKAA